MQPTQRLNFLGGTVLVPCTHLADFDLAVMAQIGVDLIREMTAIRAPFSEADEPTDGELTVATADAKRLKALRWLDSGAATQPASNAHHPHGNTPSTNPAKRSRRHPRTCSVDATADVADAKLAQHASESLAWLGFSPRFDSACNLTHLVYTKTVVPSWLDRFVAILADSACMGTLECSITDADGRTTTFSRWRFTKNGPELEADYAIAAPFATMDTKVLVGESWGYHADWQSQADLIAWVFTSGETLAREHWHDEIPLVTAELFDEPGTSVLSWLWERLCAIAQRSGSLQTGQSGVVGEDTLPCAAASLMREITSQLAIQRDEFLTMARPVFIAAYQQEMHRLTAPSPLALPDTN